ncbi:MAG: hypothetical protein FGM15_10870 [Chthoniobacterales bacterium]|nr:hypothetical protein [Chthoniobacterales bacterium]
MQSMIGRLVGSLGLQMDEVSLREKMVSSLGGLVSIAVVLVVCRAALGTPDAFFLIPSMGATAVLLFAIPHGQLSQPWPVIGGHLVSALIGVTCALWIPLLPLAAGCAVALSIAAMHFLKCIHPPGGATALTAVVGGEVVRTLGYSFVWFPVGLNAVLMVMIAVAFGMAFDGRRYPHRPQAKRSEPAAAGISHEAVIAAVRGMDTFIDVSEQDLLELHRRLLAEQRLKPDAGRSE